ncbi:MAG: HAD-IB family hydrolase [Chloroflexota bacterium]|nr:HAD-IB family hydrolase [Chloroflexota bacterium]
MIAAFFDLDGTLFTGHIWKGLSLHHRTSRMQLLQLYAFMGVHMAMWPLYLAGLISRERTWEAWARHMPWTLAGLTVERAREVFDWIWSEYVQPQLREEIVGRLRQHRAQGHGVYLLSGTMEPLLERIAQGLELEVENALGTRTEVRGGRYTGRATEPTCVGQGKVERLRIFLADHSEVDLTKSYAYADSITDLSVLETVGHPAAVYPDAGLAAIARERGWPLLGTVQKST